MWKGYPLYPALHCLHKGFHRSTLIILVNDMAGQLRHEELQDGAAGSPPQDVGQVFKGIISLITITWPHLLRGKRPSLRSESADLQTACEVASTPKVCRGPRAGPGSRRPNWGQGMSKDKTCSSYICVFNCANTKKPQNHREVEDN